MKKHRKLGCATSRPAQGITALIILLQFSTTTAFPAQDISNRQKPTGPYSYSLSYDYTVRPGNLVDAVETAEIDVENKPSAEKLGQQHISVNEHYDELLIVEAATLKADGRRLDVPADKILVQSASSGGEARYEADKKIRTLIFPDVEPGDRLRYVAKYKAKAERLPDYFDIPIAINSSQRLASFKITLDAPAGMKINESFKGFKHSEETVGGRIKHRWELLPLPYRAAEPDAVAADDSGPYVRISSFPDWQAAGEAFCGRAEPKSEVTPVVRQLAAELTKGISDRKAQAHAIYDWVTANIRYVAVNLGAGGMVPHDAESILVNRYGDCKDYATLMRALLGALGIKSEYASINTDPVYKQYDIPLQDFNHVILYMPEFDRYVDPTATHSTFQSLPGSLRNKPVLRCGYGKTTVAQTPPSSADADTIGLEAQVKVDEDGKVHGQASYTGTGTRATELRLLMVTIERYGSEDVTKPLFDDMNLNGSAEIEARASTDRSDPYNFKVSFNIDDSILGADNAIEAMMGPRLVSRPFADLRPALRVGRVSNFTCAPVSYREDVVYVLPDGWIPQKLPADVTEERGPAKYSARYAYRDGVMEVHRSYALRVSGVCEATLAGEIAPVIKAAVRDASERLAFVPSTRRSASQ